MHAILVASWDPFGLPFGTLLAPKSGQVASKTRLDDQFFEKTHFLKKRAPCGPQHDSGPQRAPKNAQDRSKRVPRRSSRRTFSLLKIDFDFVSFWDRFWDHFGSPNASLWAPFSRPKSIKKSIRNRTALKVAPRSPQGRPVGKPPPRLGGGASWRGLGRSWGDLGAAF